eukprot:TRINITY_DN4214_c0_g1_i2.p1 TRINITY_DN4214_c0_g1~~TRINITY_DN4214_c0_g1_i2.p1  ORF type:complete len:327 (+),score=74.99 TRINITY_DN4214_c0_g1_i2:113-982(+)
MRVLVKTLGGFVLGVDAEAAADVAALKSLVHAQTTVPLEGMKFVHKGKVLQEQGTLAGQGFNDGDIVVFVGRKPGQPANSPLKAGNEKASTPDKKAAPRKHAASSRLSLHSPSLPPPPMLPPQVHQQANDFWGLSPFNMDRPPAAPAPVAAHPAAAPPPVTVDPDLVSQLTEVGFSVPRVTRALLLNRMNPQLAMEWLLDHTDDPSLDAPLTPESMAMLSSPAARLFPAGAGAAALPQSLRELAFGPPGGIDMSSSPRSGGGGGSGNAYENTCNLLLSEDGVRWHQRPF